MDDIFGALETEGPTTSGIFVVVGGWIYIPDKGGAFDPVIQLYSKLIPIQTKPGDFW
jgi:hypothetical protein